MRTVMDLPPEAQKNAMQASVASLIRGEPVRVGEMLDMAAKQDPRIAESFAAGEGKPVATSPALVPEGLPKTVAQDADWKTLGRERPDYNEEQVLAASHAADKMGTPASLEPEPTKRLAAAQKSEMESAELFDHAAEYLDPELRTHIQAELAELDHLSADTQTILTRGAACLASVAAAKGR